jgi:diaminopimelate decarboxylase
MEQVPLKTIVEQQGSPCYAYSKAAISENFLNYQRALASRDHLICYAVKSNSNIAGVTDSCQAWRGL